MEGVGRNDQDKRAEASLESFSSNAVTKSAQVVESDLSPIPKDEPVEVQRNPGNSVINVGLGRFGGADFNMEAPISSEDVLRAGGLGARDEIDSFLPSASDATDFEASLRNAMEYEDVEPEAKVARPGIGFVPASD